MCSFSTTFNLAHVQCVETGDIGLTHTFVLKQHTCFLCVEETLNIWGGFVVQQGRGHSCFQDQAASALLSGSSTHAQCKCNNQGCMISPTAKVPNVAVLPRL